MDSLFGSMLDNQSCGSNQSTPISLDTAIAMEIQLYIQNAEIPLNGNPFVWWKENGARVPYLAARAKYCLTTQATSVAAERVFSTGGDVISSFRAALTPDNANILIFLQKNAKF